MRNKLIIIFFALCLTGCSSSAENADNSPNANVTQNTNTEQAAVPKNTNSGENISIPGITGPPDNSNVEVKAKSFDTTKAVEGKPAPEDSIFSTKLTDVAVETRTFKKHPVLAKVERITDANSRKIKVYLRSGKVIEIPGNNISNLSVASSAQILEAAGIEQSAPAMTPKPKSLDPKYSKEQ
jgi:hypothetical protein